MGDRVRSVTLALAFAALCSAGCSRPARQGLGTADVPLPRSLEVAIAPESATLDDLALGTDGLRPLLAYSLYRTEPDSPWPSDFRLPVCEMDAAGATTELRDLAPYVPGPDYRDYADLSLLSRDGTDLVVYDQLTSGGVQLRLAACGAVAAHLSLTPASVSRSGDALSAPDTCLRGDRVHVVGDGFAPPPEGGMAPYVSRVWCRSFEWGAWQDWTPTLGVVYGSSPTICDAGAGGLVAAVTASQASRSGTRAAPHPGPILLCRSEDGETWTAPRPTVPAKSAYCPVLAYDAAIGLVLVYAAGEREGEWPLFAARSVDLGATWGEPVALTRPDVRCYHPDALLFDGRLYIAYLDVPKPGPDQGPYALPDPTGLFTMVLDPTELPLPKVEGK